MKVFVHVSRVLHRTDAGSVSRRRKVVTAVAVHLRNAGAVQGSLLERHSASSGETFRLTSAQCLVESARSRDLCLEESARSRDVW